MKINGKDVDILRVQHRGYGYAYKCYLKPETLMSMERLCFENRETEIEFIDTAEIDQMISALQEAKKVMVDATRWERKKSLY